MANEIMLHNSKGEAVASYLHNEQTGKWRISTLAIAEFLIARGSPRSVGNQVRS